MQLQKTTVVFNWIWLDSYIVSARGNRDLLGEGLSQEWKL